MPLIAFAGARPDTGKTTVAVLVASQLASAGKRTLLVDVSPAQDALKWSQRAGASGQVLLPTTIVSYPNDAHALQALAGAFDVVVVDLPSDPLVQRRLIPAADLVVIPWPHQQPRPPYAKGDAKALVAVCVRAPRGASRALVDEQLPIFNATLSDDDRYRVTLDAGLSATSIGVLRSEIVTLAGEILAFRADDDPTGVVDMTAFVREMHTFVGKIERSLLDMSSSSERELESTRVIIKEAARSARALLGAHFKHGETFAVNDGIRFYEVAEMAERVLDHADALLEAMEAANETTRQVPAIDTLLVEVQNLVKELESLRR